MPSSVTVIDPNAFYGCSNLKPVTFKEEPMPNIYGSAFDNIPPGATAYVPGRQRANTTPSSYPFANNSLFRLIGR